MVITTLTFTGSLLLVESAGVLPVNVAVVEVVDVSFRSTGGVPSAEVIESVVTPPAVAGLITSPSSGISVFCWAARAVRPIYMFPPTSQVSRLGTDGKWIDFPPRLFATACMKSILVFDFQTPLSHDHPAKLFQSLGDMDLPALAAPIRGVPARDEFTESGTPAKVAGRSRFSRG